MFSDWSSLKEKLELWNELTKAFSMSLNIGTPSGSINSKCNLVIETGLGRGKRASQKQVKTPIKKQGRKFGASASTQITPTKSMEVSEIAKGSYVDEVRKVPHSRKTKKKLDFKSVNEVYQRFWTTCEDAYVFPVGQKKMMDISKLIAAPSTFNIRSKENRIVDDMVN
jgi:hypothetical protein